ncbi:MAG TPA: hypothetical protein VGZ52_01910 [Acidimicrobiales bacterium]|jgi:hypothetical protein|nr:hypothetical protein [Acidimicrobiales bacterium]
MYDFAVVALLALGVVKVVDFLADTVSSFNRMRSVLTFLGGLGAVWALDYSLFDRFDIAVRNRSTGIWMTGFMVCGATVAWRAMFAWLTHDRAAGDESLGVHTGLRRAA